MTEDKPERTAAEKVTAGQLGVDRGQVGQDRHAHGRAGERQRQAHLKVTAGTLELGGGHAADILAARDREYSIGGGVAGRVSAVLSYYRQMPEGVELRLHDTPLYNSIYRFDDEVLVNVHAYGILAAYTPVMHLRRVDGAFFNTYLESFERVWASARVPYWPKGDDE